MTGKQNKLFKCGRVINERTEINHDMSFRFILSRERRGDKQLMTRMAFSVSFAFMPFDLLVILFHSILSTKLLACIVNHFTADVVSFKMTHNCVLILIPRH